MPHFCRLRPSQPRFAGAVLLLALAIALAGCGRNLATGVLEYNGPTDETVRRGEMMPGTNIQYVANTPDGAQVLIGGQQALKKLGDSLNWDGSPAPGVTVSLAQRVLNANDERLLTGGTVKVTVSDVSPVEAQFPDKPLLSYKVPVVYHVARGETIPGTTISYRGKATEGADLGGVTGYQFRNVGDSISWRGRLRSNVYIDMTMRVVLYTDSFLDVTGLVTVGLTGG